MSSENRYDRRNVDNMEMLYGRGFLSGGGADEVALIFDGIDLREADAPQAVETEARTQP